MYLFKPALTELDILALGPRLRLRAPPAPPNGSCKKFPMIKPRILRPINEGEAIFLNKPRRLGKRDCGRNARI